MNRKTLDINQANCKTTHSGDQLILSAIHFVAFTDTKCPEPCEPCFQSFWGETVLPFLAFSKLGDIGARG